MNLKVLAEEKTPQQAYSAGFDCGRIGATTVNCDFRFFASHGLMQEWERGKRDAEAEKQPTP